MSCVFGLQGGVEHTRLFVQCHLPRESTTGEALQHQAPWNHQLAQVGLLDLHEVSPILLHNQGAEEGEAQG
eukprot:12920011-Prorocentrum_lima.AAC.1